MKIGVLEPENFSALAAKELLAIGSVHFFEGGNTKTFISDKEILFVRLNYFLNAAFLNEAKHLKYICSPTTGINHLDMEYLQERNVKVLLLKGESEFLKTIRATPEHTFGLALALLRNYKSAFLSTSNPQWDRDKYKGVELYENKCGIIGMGRVGEILSNYLNAFGAKVFYYDIDEKVENAQAEKIQSLNDLIDECEILFLCANYNAESPIVLGKEELLRMKHKFFINTARGELLDEEALLQLIEQDHFKGIAIDVIQDESKELNRLQELLNLVKGRNLIITPHIAGATYTSMHRTEEFLVAKLKNAING